MIRFNFASSGVIFSSLLWLSTMYYDERKMNKCMKQNFRHLSSSDSTGDWVNLIGQTQKLLNFS